MKITTRIVVRKAEPYPGGYSVEYGPSTFTYCGSFEASSYESLRAELDRVSRLLAMDTRLSGWPGMEVAAEPLGARRPNGWEANKASTRVRCGLAQIGGER